MGKIIINLKTYKKAHGIAKKYKQEIVGALIGLKLGSGDMYVFHLEPTGMGGGATVKSEKKALAAVNHILKKYPNTLDAITFHTHPSALGKHWQDHLSNGDIENLKREPNKKTVLVSGKGVYVFRITALGNLVKKRVIIKNLSEIDDVRLVEELEMRVIQEISRLV